MSEINIPERHDYKAITPFRLFVKSNFPFIESTYEALDNYGLYCKVVEYLNQVIDEQNKVNTDMVTFTDFVTNYFENLDVQEEINNKLDDLVQDGTLGNLVDNLFIDLQNQVASVASGSPAGVYATVEDLTADNPNHDRIYVVESTGNWYYYNTSTNSWASGGQYQSTGISAGSIGSLETNSNISLNVEFKKTAFSQNYDKFAVSEFELGYITPSNGKNQTSTDTVRNSIFHTLENKEIIFKTNLSILRFRYFCYNNDNSYDVDNSSAWLSNGDSFIPLLNKKYRLVIGTNNSSNFNFEYLKECGFFYTDDYIENNLPKLKELAIQNNNNYNINYKYMPFSANANTIIPDTKNLNNIEEGSISWPNGNNWDGYPAYARHKGALEIKNCIVINLKPNQYEYRFIYYTEKGGYNSSTYKGATGFYSSFRNFVNNENDSTHSIYSRIIIHDKINAKIDFEDALNNVFIINQEDKTNFKNPYIDVMLHQGGIGLGINIPSNTLNAFTNASKYDVTGFETDVRKTSDGVFVISHDLERTTTGGTVVNINQTTYENLNNMQFYADSTIKIPTLDETLKNAKLNGMKIDIELKDDFSQNEINAICKLVKENSMENHCVFSSFIINDLLYVRNVFPDVKVIIGLNSIIDPTDIETSEQYENIRTLRNQGKTLFSLENTVISSNLETIKTYINNGFNIRLCYYGNDCSQITSLVQYADTILFNTEDFYSLKYSIR